MAKPKKVAYELIIEDSVPGYPMYQMLRELVRAHHEDLEKTNARIALAWNLSWSADVDGKVTLGKMKKASDLDRELYAYDFVLLLNAEFWQDADVTDKQRRALMDHELMHGQVARDEAGDYKRDTRDRYVFRIRKHDIEEFSEVVARHGTWKRDLEIFFAALRRRQGTLPLEDVPTVGPITDALRQLMPPSGGGGLHTVTLEIGGQKVTLSREPAPNTTAAGKGR